MSEAKLVTLVRKMHQRTRGRTLRWHKTSREGVYEAEFSTYNARVFERRVSQNAQDHVLAICDKNGMAIEEIVESRFHHPEPANEMAACIKDIFNAAVVMATGTDHAIDSIIDEL